MALKLIGLTGFAGAGKDEVAKILVAEYGYTRVAFADPLREMLYALNPVIAQCDSDCACWNHDMRVQNVVDAVGWDTAKREYTEIRQLLQRLGTEAGRNVLGQNVWVNLGMSRAAEHELAVITDVRFLNEARAIWNNGGAVWRVVRPGTGAVNGHASESELVAYGMDRLVHNDGSLDDLASTVRTLTTRSSAA